MLISTTQLDLKVKQNILNKNKIYILRIVNNSVERIERGKNDFAELSKNLARCIKYNLKIILLDYQNNYVGRSS